MIARTLLSALLLSDCAASEEDVNSSSLGLRGSEERELKRCPRVDFSAPCRRAGRICFDCICLDGGWTCGLTDAQLAEAAAQVPVVPRPSLCERSNFDRPCRGRHEGRVCGDCTCTNREWVCEVPGATTPTVETVGGDDTTTAPPPPPDCSSIQNLQTGEICSSEGQECPNDSEFTDCTCEGGTWNCVPRIVGGGGSGGVSVGLCSEFDGFDGNFFPCSATGSSCLLTSGNCQAWDSTLGQCVPGTAWEAHCSCDGSWFCDPIPSCVPCSCTNQYIEDQRFCYNPGQVCRDQTDSTDCTCDGSNWGCA